MLVKTNRIYLISVLTLWLLICVFVRAENDNDTHSYHLSFFLMTLFLLLIYAVSIMLLLGQVNQLFKVFRSVLRFEDTSSLAHKVGFLDVVKAWDVGTEIKHRLWHPFWDIILTQHSSNEVCKAVDGHTGFGEKIWS